MLRPTVGTALLVAALFLFAFVVPTAARGDCDATTLDQFFQCYGGKGAFSAQSVRVLTTFIQTEDAITAGDYGTAKSLLDSLYRAYPVGSSAWSQVWGAPNGANVGSPNGYYGLRMMEDIVRYGLSPNTQAKPKVINMNIVLVGCSKGVLPTTKQELQDGTGTMVTHTMDPKVRENDYRIVRQSLDLFVKYVNAITNGELQVRIGFIELDTMCLPVSVTKTKPYFATGNYGLVLGALSKAARDSTDWFLISYPSHVPDAPVFNDETFITGGMGSDSKGGPVFIADDKWVTRKPAHLGKGNYTDIERRLYLPQWLQHEFFHHLYGIYPELKLEVKGHDWFDRSFWPADFTGQYETDYYSETLHKRLQRQCLPLSVKLLTRTDRYDKTVYGGLGMDELLGSYSLDNIQNPWHEADIIKEGSLYYWKNKANVKWEVTPMFNDGMLKTSADCPYPGRHFLIQLYQSSAGQVYPAAVALSFGGEPYKKRFGFMRQSTPMEIATGTYERVPNITDSHTGNVAKTQGRIVWRSDAGESWTLVPTAAEECLYHASDSPTPGERCSLILVDTDCGIENLGFRYMNHYYWKPKRSPANESPRVVNKLGERNMSKDSAKQVISMKGLFEDPTADSLLYFVTSTDTSVVHADIDHVSLTLRGGGNEGTSTVYVMALDKNGGLAVQEFTAVISSSSTDVEQSDSAPHISFAPNPTSDIVMVTGMTSNSRLVIISVTGSYQETFPVSEHKQQLDLSHVSAGIYMVIYTDGLTGRTQATKLIKR